MPVSEAQKRARDKWISKNKDKQKYINYRSFAKKFITEMAKKEDLQELE